MAKAKVNVEEAVRPLLAALAGGEARLLGAGDPPPLLPGKTGANKPVYDRLTGGDAPLVTVRKDGKAEVARLTAAGFVAALPHLQADRVGELAGRFAESLPVGERLTFLLDAGRYAGGESAAVLAAAVDALRAEIAVEAAASARRHQAEGEIIERLVALKRDDVRRLRDDLAAAEAMVKRLGGTVEAPAPSSPPPPATTQPLAPTDADDLPFRRQVLQRLATTWLEAVENQREEGRRYLEAAIHNLRGVRRIGEAGESVRFRGAVHRARRPVAEGESVKVVRPGWELDEDDGTFLVLPAEVA